jgi:hypothetical protein
MPCSLLKVNSGCYLLRAGFLSGLFFDSENGGDMFLWNINGLHGIISQKIELLKKYVRIADVLTETEHLPNKCKMHYCLSQLPQCLCVKRWPVNVSSGIILFHLGESVSSLKTY